MPAPAVPVPAQGPCSSAEPLPRCEQGSMLGVLRALSLPREHWDVPSPSRASQGDSLAGGFTPWVCVGTAEPAPHPAGLMSLRAAAAGGFAVPSKPGHTPVPSWGSVSLPGRDCPAFGGSSCPGVSPVLSRGTGGWEGLALPQAVPRSGIRPFRRSCSPWYGGHCLACLFPGPEMWERELRGHPSTVPSYERV